MSEPLNPPPRLKDSQGPIAAALRKVARPTPSPGARDRVWRKLAAAAPPARRWVWMLTGASLATAAAIAVAFFATRPAPVAVANPVVAPVTMAPSRPQQLLLFASVDTQVAASPETNAKLLDVQNGRARIELRSGKLEVRVGANSPAVEVVGVSESATFSQGFASVSAEKDGLLLLEVDEGEAYLREAKTTVRRKQQWREQPRMAAVQTPQGMEQVVRPVERKGKQKATPVVAESKSVEDSAPVEVPSPIVAADPALEVRRALELARKKPADGAAALSALRDGPQGELALYELGRLQASRLGQPQRAVATFAEHAQKFPAGTLAPEVQLSLAEVQLRLGRNGEALRALDSFVALAGPAERTEEVAFLRGNILRAERECARALVLLQPIAEGGGARAEKALYLVADCQAALGRTDEARETLRQYLSRYPNGTWKDAAARALGERQ